MSRLLPEEQAARRRRRGESPRSLAIVACIRGVSRRLRDSARRRIASARMGSRVRGWGFDILSGGGWTTRAFSRFLVLDGDRHDQRGAGRNLVPGSVVEGRHRLRRRRPVSRRHALLRRCVPRPVRRARLRRHRRRPPGDHLSRRGRRLLRLHARLPLHLRNGSHDLLPAARRGDVRGMPLIRRSADQKVRSTPPAAAATTPAPPLIQLAVSRFCASLRRLRARSL